MKSLLDGSKPCLYALDFYYDGHRKTGIIGPSIVVRVHNKFIEGFKFNPDMPALEIMKERFGLTDFKYDLKSDIGYNGVIKRVGGPQERHAGFDFTEFKVNLPWKKTQIEGQCSKCGGSAMIDDEDCPDCFGTGFDYLENEDIESEINTISASLAVLFSILRDDSVYDISTDRKQLLTVETIPQVRNEESSLFGIVSSDLMMNIFPNIYKGKYLIADKIIGSMIAAYNCMNFGGDPTDSKSKSELAKFRIDVGDQNGLLIFGPDMSGYGECFIHPHSYAHSYGNSGAYKYTSKDINSPLIQLVFLAGLAQLYREGQFWMHRPYM